MHHRPGVTRVDVVFATLILAVVAGLLLIGVSHARQEAAAAQCRNNLKQLGIGVSAYEDTYARLPPLVDQGDRALTGRGLPSVFATLTPYLESTFLYFRPERPVDYYHAHSSVVLTYRGKDDPIALGGGMANQRIRYFLDPADDTARQFRDVPMTLPDGTTGYYATGSYAANGLLPWGRRPAFGANTLLIGERPQVCRTAAGDEVYNLWGLGIYGPNMPAFATLTPADPAGLTATGQAAPVVPLPADRDAAIRVGRQDAEASAADFGCPFQSLRGGPPCDPRRPGTLHRGGMQTVMADGSVRVFAPDTSPRVFWAACVPADP